MQDLYQADARLSTSTDPIPETGVFKPAYGVGGYLECVVREDDERCEALVACKTPDGECAWWEVQSDERPLEVKVVRGDIERIRALVRAEVEHFDSELTWID